MHSLAQDYPDKLLNVQESPCISLYQPTHRTFPDRSQDVIRFKNLIKQIEASLQKKYSESETKRLLKPFYELMKNQAFWNHPEDGLAVLATPHSFRVYKLPRPVSEIAVVSDSFHIKPLIRLMQSADRYQILGINRERVWLYEGNRDILQAIELAEEVPETITEALGEALTEPHLTVATYGKGAQGPAMHHGHGGRKADLDLDAERFFRQVDEAFFKHHVQSSKLPVILAALPEYHHLFHKISHNPYLLEQGIKLNPNDAKLTVLKSEAWAIMEPHYLKRLEDLLNAFKEAHAKALGSDDVSAVAEAALAGRVATLLLDGDRRIPGQIDHESGEVALDELLNPETDDVLDDLGELVLKTDGEVWVVPESQMPTKTGVAAIYRF